MFANFRGRDQNTTFCTTGEHANQCPNEAVRKIHTYKVHFEEKFQVLLFPEFHFLLLLKAENFLK